MRNNYSADIVNSIRGFLIDDDWKYTFDEEKGIFRFNLGFPRKVKKISFLIMVHEGSYTVYAVSPIGVEENDAKMMAEMAEFVCRANYGLRNGNFELDVEDGQIRYKSFVNCKGIIPSRAVVSNSVYVTAGMFKRYGKGIIDILFSGANAKDAVYMCENSD